MFALEYYATTDPLHDNMPPVRTWYYQTDNNGRSTVQGKAYLVPELTESDGSVLWSDELYREKMETCFIQLVPIVYEISAPKYFKLEGNMHFVENTDVCPDVKTGLDAVLRQPRIPEHQQNYMQWGKKSHGEILIQNLSVHA